MLEHSNPKSFKKILDLKWEYQEVGFKSITQARFLKMMRMRVLTFFKDN